jgi:hypothetical protein
MIVWFVYDFGRNVPSRPRDTNEERISREDPTRPF